MRYIDVGRKGQTPVGAMRSDFLEKFKEGVERKQAEQQHYNVEKMPAFMRKGYKH